MKVLIIEDEELIRETVAYQFKANSAEVSEARNGIEGLALLKQKTFDLVVSDYQMPKMSGLDLLQVCRGENIRVPIIWLSGRDNPELRAYAWQFGLFDYIEKPFEPEEFKKCVSQVESMSDEVKKEFFTDYSSGLFNIPYSVISEKISKPTIRSFLEWCETQNASPTEMIAKILAEA